MANKKISLYLGETKFPPSHFEASGEIHSMFNACVRGQLLTRTKGFKLAPGLIHKYYYDFEKNEYILQLRKGLTFHNGRKATAKDLEFSLIRGFFSTKPNFFSTRFGNILGVDDIKPGTKYKVGLVKGIRIIDDMTLAIKLKSPNPSFFYNLNSPYYSLIPIEELNDDYLTWKGKVVGVGEYRVKSENIKDKITILSKADNNKILLYWGEKPPKDIDISITPIDNFKTTQSKYPVAVRLIEFSSLHPLSQHKNFRQALNYLFDRNEFKHDEFGISPLSEILPIHFWGRTNNINQYNIKEAKKLLSEIPKELLNKEYNAIVFSKKDLSPYQKFYVEIIEKQLASVGLKIKILPNSEKFLSQKTAKRYPFRLVGKIVDYVDPLIMFGSYRDTGHDEYLRAQGDDAIKYQQLYVNAANVESLTSRIDSVKILNNFTVDNAVVVPIAEEKTVYYTNPNTIKSLGEQFEPMTLFIEKVEFY